MKQYKFNRQAVYIGMAIFIVSYFIVLLLEHYLLPHIYFQAKGLVLLILSVILQAFSGYIAGSIAKVNGWLNGFMVGLIASVVVGCIDIIINPPLINTVSLFMPMRILESIIICSIGGLCWDLYTKYNIYASNQTLQSDAPKARR